jgi:hypothetical protein
LLVILVRQKSEMVEWGPDTASDCANSWSFSWPTPDMRGHRRVAIAAFLKLPADCNGDILKAARVS